MKRFGKKDLIGLDLGLKITSLMKRFGKKDLIGLDLGSHSIKIVEISKSKKGPRLKNLGILNLTPGSLTEDAIRDREAIIQAVRNLLDHLRIKPSYVAASISGPSVVIKRVTLPIMTEEELEKSLIFEAEPYIPFDIQDVNMDFHIIAESEKTPDQMDILLVAAKKEVVNEYAAILEACGLVPAIIDAGCLALANAYEISYPIEDDSCSLLVDIGAEKMTINAVKKEIPIFMNEVPLGGKQITHQIESNFNISFEEAEKLKIGEVTNEEQKKELEDIFVSIISTWADEIGQAVDLLATTLSKDAIKKIILSGGSSRIPDLDRLITTRTNIPVEILNPFSSIQSDENSFDSGYLKYMGPQVATCVGLALRRIGDR